MSEGPNQEQRADAREARTEASAVAREASAVAREATTAARAETLAAVAEGLDALARAVDTNLSEERLAGIIAGEQLANERKLQRLNIILAITLIVAIIGLAGIWAQSRANHDQGARIQATSRDAAVVADYVKACLQAPAAQRDRAKCGADGTSAVVNGLVGFIECGLLIRPEARTRPQLDACAADAFKGTP